MPWYRFNRSQHADATVSEKSSVELKHEESNLKHEPEAPPETPREKVPKSDPKVVLPVVFSLCLAVFLTALVSFSCTI